MEWQQLTPEMSCWKKYRAWKFRGHNKNVKQIIEPSSIWLLRMERRGGSCSFVPLTSRKVKRKQISYKGMVIEPQNIIAKICYFSYFNMYLFGIKCHFLFYPGLQVFKLAKHPDPEAVVLHPLIKQWQKISYWWVMNIVSRGSKLILLENQK